MEPAHTIVKRLGGEARVSEITGTSGNAPYRWQYPREKGGTGGLIPQRYHRTLLNHARDEGVDLKAEDFLAAEEVAQ